MRLAFFLFLMGSSFFPGVQIFAQEISVAFIAADLKNGGISGVYQSFLNASRELGWKVSLKDANGDESRILHLIEEIPADHARAIVLGGFDTSPEVLKLISERKWIAVGWHSGTEPGPQKGLAANISTSAIEVARLAAQQVQEFSNRTPRGVVILTDNQFDVAKKKTAEMKRILQRIPQTTVLTVENIPISSAHNLIPTLVRSLNQKYGTRWTHTLAINDVYFDHMNIPLMSAKRPDIINIAAGDGSRTAINRIKSGISQQAASVAEPLIHQGWQIADEIYLALKKKPWSKNFTSPIVVTKKNLDSNPNIEDITGLRDKYLSKWKGPE
ncbi:MAG TPA: substrate-binding domain-containing protein [Pseudobdellovibrionaceae bacterium]|nr:substrate-binding domain-containing protein [Pseudobdellovibrionaceae bacterium]